MKKRCGHLQSRRCVQGGVEKAWGGSLCVFLQLKVLPQVLTCCPRGCLLPKLCLKRKESRCKALRRKEACGLALQKEGGVRIGCAEGKRCCPNFPFQVEPSFEFQILNLDYLGGKYVFLRFGFLNKLNFEFQILNVHLLEIWLPQ